MIDITGKKYILTKLSGFFVEQYLEQFSYRVLFRFTIIGRRRPDAGSEFQMHSQPFNIVQSCHIASGVVALNIDGLLLGLLLIAPPGAQGLDC